MIDMDWICLVKIQNWIYKLIYLPRACKTARIASFIAEGPGAFLA
jgi:hypothetical protein